MPAPHRPSSRHGVTRERCPQNVTPPRIAVVPQSTGRDRRRDPRPVGARPSRSGCGRVRGRHAGPVRHRRRWRSARRGALQPADDRPAGPRVGVGESGHRHNRWRDEEGGRWRNADGGGSALPGSRAATRTTAAPPRIRPGLPARLPAVSDGESRFLTVSAVFCSSVHPMNTVSIGVSAYL